MSAVALKTDMMTGHHPDKLIQALYTAYRVSPGFQDVEVDPDANGHQVLHLLWHKVVAQKPEGIEMGIFTQLDPSPCAALIEPIIVDDILSFPLKPLVTSAKIDRTVREALLSLIHYLLTTVHIPDWFNATEYAEITVSDYAGDDGPDYEDHVERLKANLEFYHNGEPAIWLKRIRNMKPWPLDRLRKLKTRSRRVNKIIAATLAVIEHPLTFTDYHVVDHYDYGLFPDAHIYFAWDYTEPVDEHYLDYIGSHVDNGDLTPPVCLYRLRTREDWNFKFHGQSFFQPLRTYFDEMLNLLR
jgi:hypothetical protein